MKNMKKLLQKAMVFTLTAAMLIGTPMSASAAGLVDLYSISDGSGNWIVNDGNPTGTVSNTDTNTNSGVLSSNDAKIMGIVLDQSNITAEVDGKQQTITATIILDGAKDEAEKAEILEKLNSKIKWEVLNKEGDKYNENPSTVLAIEASAADRTVVKLKPKKGSLPGQEIIVRASIDGRYYYNSENQKVEIATGVANAYKAEATVFVKQYSTKLEFKDVPSTVYVKHTMDMNKYLVRTPERANDTITWTSDNASIAPVTAAGVVTFKKVDPSKKVTIQAVGEQGAVAKYTFGKDGQSVIDAGVPASRIEIWHGEGADAAKVTKLDADMAYDGAKSQINRNVTVKMWAKVNALVDDSNAVVTEVSKVAAGANGKYKSKSVELAPGDSYFEVSKDKKAVYGLDAQNKKVDTGYTQPLKLSITDEVDWSSSKAAIASVGGNTAGAVVRANSVGKANIVAKASSGKKATLAYTVKATLKTLGVEKVETPLYTGQTFQLTATKDPAQNKDAISFFLTDSQGKTKKTSKSVTVNAKGVVTVKPQIDGGKTSEEIYVGVKTNGKVQQCKNNEIPETKDYVYAAEPIKIILKQSSIKDITVQDDANSTIAKVALKPDGSAVGKSNDGLSKADNTTKISVPKGRTYTAVVTPSDGDNYKDCKANTLAWKSSSTKVAEIVDFTDDGVVIKAKAKGTSTVTVSGITMINNKAKVMKTTFKVEVKQPVNTVTMNKPTVILTRKTKGAQKTTASQKVALKVTLGPKGVDSKETVTWDIQKFTTAADGTLVKAEGDKADGTIAPVDSKGKPVTKTSATFELKIPEIGDVYKVTAQAGTASATSYIYILDQTKSVKIAKNVTKSAEGVLTVEEFTEGTKKDTTILQIGSQPITMVPVINLGTPNAPDYHEMAEVTVADGKVTKAVEKNVTYTVNKKGIVTIDADGNVYPIKKGKVTITAKTPGGKSGKLTINVTE